MPSLSSAWGAIVSEFTLEGDASTEAADRSRPDLEGAADDVADWLDAEGHALGRHRGKVFVACPWKDGHSSYSGISETAWLVAGSRGFERGHFQCLHASCSHRTDDDFLRAVGFLEGAFRDLDGAPTIAVRTAGKFRVHTGSEILAAPNPTWWVKGVLPEAALAIVFGDSGSGKTFWLLDVALQVAQGAPWRGRRVRRGRVVYIAAEGGGGLGGRMAAWTLHHARDTPAMFGAIKAAPDLRTGDVGDVIAGIAEFGGADIVVVDTLAQTTPGANENSSEDMGKALAACREIHEATGALVVVVHHSGKDASKGPRGWSGLYAAADAVIEVVRTDQSRHARIVKQKDGEEGARFGFALAQVVLGYDDDGDPITSMVVEQAENVPTTPKLGARQLAVLATVKQLVEGMDDQPTRADILAHLLEHSPHQPGPDLDKPKRDRRAEVYGRAFDELIGRGLVREQMSRITLPAQSRASPHTPGCGDVAPLQPPHISHNPP